MESALAARSAKQWLGLLEADGVPCAPINDIAAVMSDSQVLARNMIVTADDPDLGPVRMQGNPIKLSSHTDPKVRSTAPDLDSDRVAILKELGI
jgi:CoA:oxalate CoA-transferase